MPDANRLVAGGADAGRRRWHALALGGLGMALGLGGAAAELTAGPGYRMGLWSLSSGIDAVRWGAIVATVGGVVSLWATGWAWSSRASPALGIAGVLVALLAVATPAMLWQRAQRLPPIHDIATDPAHPPPFVAILPLRRGAPNPSLYDASTAPLQQEAYPDIVPLHLPRTGPVDAVAQAARIARDLGWSIVAQVSDEGRLEATATSLLFGFKDDVVVRVEPEGQGSRVDVRSASRVGRSDLGVNAARIRDFLARMKS